VQSESYKIDKSYTPTDPRSTRETTHTPTNTLREAQKTTPHTTELDTT
jgi:hypothetical protein